MISCKESYCRSGIDDRPLTQAEFEKIRKKGSLYKRTVVPKKPSKEKNREIPVIDDRPKNKEEILSLWETLKGKAGENNASVLSKKNRDSV